MKIVINCISFNKHSACYSKYFIKCFFTWACNSHKEDEFIFLVNEECNGQFLLAPNAREMNTGKKKSSVALTAFYKIQLPLILKKIKPDVVIQPFGKAGSGTVPQIIIFEESQAEKISGYTVSKAGVCLCFTQHAVQKIRSLFSVHEKKIIQAPFITEQHIHELSLVQKQQQLARITNGKAFFLFYDDGILPEEALCVLKAFSLFKKRMQSNMQLVVVSINQILLEEKLRLYKYRADVILFAEEAMNNEILQAAYGFIQLNQNGQLSALVTTALLTGVPVITAPNEGLAELFDTSLLMPETISPEKIAEYLNLLYRDETYRKAVIANGKEKMRSFNAENDCGRLWKTITETVRKT